MNTTQASAEEDEVTERPGTAQHACGASLGESRPACLYCAGTDFVPLYQNVRDRLGYVEGTWEFIRCTVCGSALLWPQPDPAELASFYPPVYSFSPEVEQPSRLKRWLNKLEYRFFFNPQYQRQVRRVVSITGRPATGTPRLLDVGCGRGLRLLAFQESGFECSGSDFQPEVAEDVRQRLGIPVACCDVSQLTQHFPGDTFDVVTAFFLLEHVPDVAQVLVECLGLLKPGGWLVGAVPFLDAPQRVLFGRRWINVAEAPRHLSLPTINGMKQLCQNVGYGEIVIRPDSNLSCAGQVATSLLPGASFTQAYGNGSRWIPMLLRIFAGTVTLAALPWVFLENQILHRPAGGIVFAQKPIGRESSP